MFSQPHNEGQQYIKARGLATTIALDGLFCRAAGLQGGKRSASRNCLAPPLLNWKGHEFGAYWHSESGGHRRTDAQ